MIRAILWDVDNTLLNFPAAERRALLDTMDHFRLPPGTEEQVARYSAINDRWWKSLERGEITKPQLLTGRFAEFFRGEGLQVEDLAAFNRHYQALLGETIVYLDDSGALIASLQGKVRQYAVTNGTKAAQTRKLEKSGIGPCLDGVFISEEVGAEKPSPAFFDHVLAAIGPCRKEEVLIVGDSLTSDMLGGQRAGIRCCWYDPTGLPAPSDRKLDYIIGNLGEVQDILQKENGSC